MMDRRKFLQAVFGAAVLAPVIPLLRYIPILEPYIPSISEIITETLKSRRNRLEINVAMNNALFKRIK